MSPPADTSSEAVRVKAQGRSGKSRKQEEQAEYNKKKIASYSQSVSFETLASLNNFLPLCLRSDRFAG